MYPLPGGMDLCAKASKLLKCGEENSPDAVAGLMNNLENALTVLITILLPISIRIFILNYKQEAPIILPPKEAVCPVNFKCIVEVLLYKK